MLTQLITLLPILATLAPVLAAPTTQPIALAGRGNALKHGDMGKRGSHGRAVKRTCKVRTSVSASAAASSIAASTIGDNAQAAGVVSSAAASQSVPTTSGAGVASAVASSAIALGADASTASYAVSSSTSSSASAAASSASSGGATVNGKAALTPNGNKAGMTLCTGIDSFSGKLGWCYDWTPAPSAPSGMVGVSMLWGDGGLGNEEDDSARVASFQALTTSPAYIIGFEEPDCSTTGSADMTVEAAAAAWNSMIAPHGAAGSLLISPSMCHQAAETYLTPFKQAITTDWDVTNLHINKNSMEGVKKDLDHYWDTYGKPMWVTEFACVDDSTDFVPCTDQGEISQFISDIVKLFEKDSRVYAYAYSNGEGLGDVWPAISNGQLTTSGQAYLSAVSQYH